ncbi:MAG: hypothetical protein QXM38_04075 [Candidatus Aenigmatarchaeota archaeon]
MIDDNVQTSLPETQESLKDKKIFVKIKELKYPLIVIIPIVLIQLFTISQFKQFPGPLYGGDIYWHFGEVLNIYNGNPPWSNPQVSGEYAYYGWLTQFLIALIAKLTKLNVYTVYLYFPVILSFTVGIVSYALGMDFFKNKKFAILFSLLSISFSYTVTDIWRILGDIILMMLFILFFVRAIKTNKLSYKIFSGLFYGFAGLTHVVAFPSITIFIFLFFIYNFFLRSVTIRLNAKDIKIIVLKSDKKESKKDIILLFFTIFIIGFLISMLFFGPIIFVYRGKIKNPLHEYTEPDVSKYGIYVLFTMLSDTFFNTNSIISLIISIITLAGLYFVIKNRDDLHARTILLLVLSAFVSGSHYFLTLPIFGISLIPMYFYGFLMKVTIPLLFVFAIQSFYEKIKNMKAKKLFFYIVFLFLIANMISIANSVYNDKWVSLGRMEPNPVLNEIVKWINENTNKDDVFLSNEELSFAINGLTGRKVVISRRTHFSPYIDINKRVADAAIILYGNNPNKSVELLKKYNISYLYWDVNWIYFAQNEPSLTSLEHENYLYENGVKFQKIETYLDPAWEKWHPKYKVLAIIPAKLDESQPWSDTFQKYLKLEKTFYIDGKEFAKIYKIEYY